MADISIKCDPTPPELKESVGAVFKKRRRNKIISFSIVFLALSILLFSTESLLNLSLGFVCVGFAIIMPLVHIISALIAIRDTERQRFELSFEEKGLNIQTKHSYFADYSSTEAFESEKVITLLDEGGQIFCVPKRCFENEKKLAEFEENLSEKLQKRYIKR